MLNLDVESVYGPGTAAALGAAPDALLQQAAREFVPYFYAIFAGTPEGGPILGRLLPEEFAHLQARQTEHFTMLFDPHLTPPRHLTAAQQAGRVHALIGVDLLMVSEAYTLYQQYLQDELLPKIEPSCRDELMRAIIRRIMADLRGQALSYRRIDAEVSRAIAEIDQLIHATANFSDLIRGAMAVIGNLEGNSSGFFARVDQSGELRIEASQGAAGHRYHQAMMSGEIPRISIDVNRDSGRGPGGMAWRSGKVVVSDAWALEPRNEPWKKLGIELGFRASAAIPLLGGDGESIALLSWYSPWPGYFSTPRMSNFFNYVQTALSHAVSRLNAAPVVALSLRQSYRGWIAEGRIALLYQPIVDLRTGTVTKVEALARLVDDEGRMVTPDRFLPACGSEELFTLLQAGLRRAGEDRAIWTEAGVDLSVALNFPAEGVGDPRYERAVFEAIERFRFGDGRLTLEILESREGSDPIGRQQAFLQRLRDVGVAIAEDDLGSGHSSLLRLDRYAFDEVKMDQELVRGSVSRPQRALEFMLYLARLTHSFGMRLTVEGLEHRGLIEAASILGADQGQGYGIAKPMPMAEIPGWIRQFRHDVKPDFPETTLGAMATYMLWDLEVDTRLADGDGGVVDRRRSVKAFLAHRGLQRSDLARLIDEHFASGAAARATARVGIIDGFTQVWLDEIGLDAVR